MSEEPRTMQTAGPAPDSAPEDAPALVKKIGRTTYMVHVYFSKTRTEIYGRQNQASGSIFK